MIYQLDKSTIAFPHPRLAEEDGLLAIGGDLSSERLLLAYEHGIFPWYSADTPILWYAPHERFVLFPDKIKISKSMQKLAKSNRFTVTVNRTFDQVIKNCASTNRRGQDGTWIGQDMINAYNNLHRLGYAQSIEVWEEEKLVGGLYGILVDKVFCGESMFSLVSNTSKLALIYLARNFNLQLIDCQIHSAHLESLGAELIPQPDFLHILAQQQINQHGLQRIIRYT